MGEMGAVPVGEGERLVSGGLEGVDVWLEECFIAERRVVADMAE
jgi:hypothetical protein